MEAICRLTALLDLGALVKSSKNEYGKKMTTGLTSKLLKLEQEKLKLESEITELKQQQVKEVSALLMCLCEDHSMDPMTLIGSLLETLKDTKKCTQKKEEWLKDASTFRKKNRARISSLLDEKG